MADPPPRFAALDVLRGVAVMGILLMNVIGFGLPEAAYLNPAAYGGSDGADLAAWMIGFVLIDGKMRALFSLLFGASMLLVIDRADAAGGDGMTVHYRRMASLFGIGVIHAYLVWAGDILIPYAVVGMLAYAFVERRTASLVVLALVLFVAQWLLLASMIAGIAAVRDAALAPGATADAITLWRAFADQAGIPSEAAIARVLATYRGSYGEIVAERLAHWNAPILQLASAGPETLALMLLGMAGLKSGFLTGSWSRVAYGRVAATAYLIGIPALALIARATVASGFDEVATLRAAELYAAPFRPLVMIGHAASILLWLKGAEGSPAAGRIAAVGRAAFSNYLGTSVVMTFLFYGYGSGWFGQLGRAELYLVVPPIWAAMLLWSEPWLRHFRYGPLEWLWRSLSRGTPQPMRRP